MALKGELQDLYKGVEKGTLEIALKGALDVTLELHMLMQLSKHKSVQNDSVKGEIELVPYVALLGASS